MEKERLEYLLNRYFDDALSEEERAELERMLLESAASREMFWEIARWHAALRQWGQEEWGRRDALAQAGKESPSAPASPRIHVLRPPVSRKPSPPLRSRPAQRRPSSSSLWWPLAAAAAVMLGIFGWMNWPSPSPSPSSGFEAAVAVLRQAPNAVWADENSSHWIGESLRPGPLKLRSGAIQVELSKGARVVLEGPAEIELLTENSTMLRFGKLVATVPESAHGFAVKTSEFTVVDFGTQFGCIVPISGASEVHVFRGAVEVETAANQKRELHEDLAVRIDKSEMQEIPADPNAFTTEEKLARLGQADPRARLAAWRQSNPAFSSHPGMLAHFVFEKEGADGILLNRAPGAPEATNARIVGCDWAEGRWPGKGALAFTGDEDRLQLSIEGEFSAMTFLAWVRVESTPFGENCLVRANDEDQLGSTNWYIFRDGSLGWSARVAPRGSASQWLHVNSTPVFRGDALETWRLAATVFDGQTVTHYLDGKPVGSSPATLKEPLRLGLLDVGNRGASIPLESSVRRQSIGSFFGRIDELAILSVPLTAEEIQRLYEEGRPDEN